MSGSHSGWCGPTIIATAFYGLGMGMEIINALYNLNTRKAENFEDFLSRIVVYSIISLFWILVYYTLCASGVEWLAWTIFIIKLFAILLIIMSILYILVREAATGSNKRPHKLLQ